MIGPRTPLRRKEGLGAQANLPKPDQARVEEREHSIAEQIAGALSVLIEVAQFVPYVYEPEDLAIAFERSEFARSKLNMLFSLDPNLVHVKAAMDACLAARAVERAISLAGSRL